MRISRLGSSEEMHVEGFPFRDLRVQRVQIREVRARKIGEVEHVANLARLRGKLEVLNCSCDREALKVGLEEDSVGTKVLAGLDESSVGGGGVVVGEGFDDERGVKSVDVPDESRVQMDQG